MTEEKQCDCKEKAIAKLKEFLFIAGAVFVGGTLAILLSVNLLKPKCPPPPMRQMPPMEWQRQLPPPPPGMHGDFDRGMVNRAGRDCPCKKFKHHKGEFKRPPHQDKAPQIPEKAPINKK